MRGMARAVLGPPGPAESPLAGLHRTVHGPELRPGSDRSRGAACEFSWGRVGVRALALRSIVRCGRRQDGLEQCPDVVGQQRRWRLRCGASKIFRMLVVRAIWTM